MKGKRKKEMIYKWDARKNVIKLTDGMIYIEGDTMYRVKLEPIAKMEYASLEE
jgi:hypothetical protein